MGPADEKPAEQAVERLLRLAERPREDQNPLSVRDGEHAPAVEIAVAERHRRQECAATGGRGRGRVEKSRQRRRVGAHDVPVRADDLRDRARLARVGVEDRALLRGAAIDSADCARRAWSTELRSASSTRRYTNAPSARSSAAIDDGEGGGEAPADAGSASARPWSAQPVADAADRLERVRARTAGRSSRGGSARRRRRRSSVLSYAMSHAALEQLDARERLARASHEDLEQRELLRGQLDLGRRRARPGATRDRGARSPTSSTVGPLGRRRVASSARRRASSSANENGLTR